MSDSKLESFKVADKHKPRVKSSTKLAADKGVQASGEAQTQTLGFDRIEAILDHENPITVQKSLQKLIDGLDSLSSKAGNQKDRGQAKRAKVAVERTTDLLTYLFETKNSMLEAVAKASKGAQDGKGKRPAARKGDK